MFVFYECIRSALKSLVSRGLSSVLTILGVVIAVASVISVVSVIQGLSFSVTSQYSGLGSNSLTVRSFTSYESQMRGHYSRLTSDDYHLIRDRVTGIDSITPISYSLNTSRVGYESRIAFTRVMGTSESYKYVQDLYMRNGRFISESDGLTRRKICVIGESVREKLSLPKNPIGSFIEINSVWLKVVGLVEPKGNLLGYSLDDYVLIPFETMRSFNGADVPMDIQVQLSVKQELDPRVVADNIRELLRRYRDRKDLDEDDFLVESPEQLMATVSKVSDTITMVMAGIVGISLVVGGIGIMNIMLVSVTERTKEIGICKAIGAKNSYVLIQFLTESVVLCLSGGVVGVILGYLIGFMFAAIIPGFPDVKVPLWAILASLAFSSAIGVVFGIIPALKAANLEPIDALKYE